MRACKKNPIILEILEMPTSTNKIIRIAAIFIIALLAWFGLSLQFTLIVDATKSNGKPLADEVVRFFSYFTILTNLLVAICLSNLLRRPRSRFGKYLARTDVQTALALYIGVVGLVYLYGDRKSVV